jgi:hypothetical protein
MMLPIDFRLYRLLINRNISIPVRLYFHIQRDLIVYTEQEIEKAMKELNQCLA